MRTSLLEEHSYNARSVLLERYSNLAVEEDRRAVGQAEHEGFATAGQVACVVDVVQDVAVQGTAEEAKFESNSILRRVCTALG